MTTESPKNYYIQKNLIDIEEIRDTYVKKEESKVDSYQKHTIPSDDFLPQETITLQIEKKLIKAFIEFSESTFEIESKIKEASLHLEKIRKKSKDIDISKKLWNYSQKLLRNISFQYMVNFREKIPEMRFNFMDDIVQIRWESDKLKFILNLTDDIDDIIVYVKTSTGQYLDGTIQKEKIVDWVFFWLKQI